ncbi:MAG: hypothetical protein HQ551_02540 [Desulfobacteraceae bacterium]|nr:hypothetical protein [Desulfobacteraceae bacterium]
MASKDKQVRLDQKSYLEEKLNQRLTVLAGKGLLPERIAKDVTVRKIRAKMRETEGRLKVIAELEKKTEEKARIKVEKMALPKKEKKKKEAEKVPVDSKRQKKKEKKSKENKKEG